MENIPSVDNIDITTFKKAIQKMVSKNDQTWENSYTNYYRFVQKLRDYKPEEIDNIINSGSLQQQQRLSRNYFYKDGFYKRIILYYATLPKYSGVLIPIALNGKNLSDSHMQKKYQAALNYVESLPLTKFWTDCSLKAIRDGGYYGVIQEVSKSQLVIVDLPSEFCRSRFKDLAGNDIVEFDVNYFNKIPQIEARNEALSAYPDFIQRAYRAFSKGKILQWIKIPSDKGVCFSMFGSRPLFLTIIPATIKYDEGIEIEQERNLEEIRKIIVQHMPHLNDGQLVFEPEEAAEMHAGTVGMMSGNKNVSVLTSYADVDCISSKASSDVKSDIITDLKQNIYSMSGVSSEIFAPTGNLAIDTSIKNDMALMMYMCDKYSLFLTNVVNSLFGNSNILFKYNILPINYYNETEYINNSFKLAQSGYSYLLPALAMGVSQRDLTNLKDLENDVLKLGEKLIPLQSAYTQSSDGDGPGAPEKPIEEKSPKTIENEQSIDNTGGSN